MRSFPRRQQYRRMRRALTCGVASPATCALAAVAAGLGAFTVAAVLLLATVGLAVRARHWIRLAGRSQHAS